MKVRLDVGEMATVRMIANLRRSMDEMTGIKEPLPIRSTFEDEMNGIIAEFAFAKWRNVYPDLSCQPRAGSHDCRVGNCRVDVKAITQRHHNLIARHTIGHKSEPADRYVLGVVEGCEVEFLGWAPAAEFICDETVTDLGHGPTYVLPQSRLRPFRADLSSDLITT